MMPEAFESVYYVLGRDYANAGKVSTQIKDTLKRLGIHPAEVRRVAIDSYEAEMNLVMYATRGPLPRCGRWDLAPGWGCRIYGKTRMNSQSARK
jgi:hypothetical protein